MIDAKDIPYSYKYSFGDLNITFPADIVNSIVPEIYDDLVDEDIHIIHISNVINLNRLNTFNNLKKFDCMIISNNTYLNEISGFNSLENVMHKIYIRNNPHLISMSLPNKLIKAVYSEYNQSGYIDTEFKGVNYGFKNPHSFFNDNLIILDFIEKFDWRLHSDVVVEQIIKNLEEWGTDETISIVVNKLMDTGACTFLPQKYLNKYDLGTIKNNNKIISEVFGD